MSWCRWCGDDLPQTQTSIGDFCGPPCSRSYHEDVGGYAWILDLIEIRQNKGRELDSPKKGTSDA